MKYFSRQRLFLVGKGEGDRISDRVVKESKKKGKEVDRVIRGLILSIPKAAIAAAIPRLAGPFGPIEEGFGAGDALSVFGEGSGLSGVGWRSGTVGGWVGGLMLSLLIGVASMG